MIEGHTILNPIQLHLLQMFSYTKSEKELLELKNILVEFYRKNVDKEVDEIWQTKGLTEKSMADILKSHKRTPYK